MATINVTNTNTRKRLPRVRLSSLLPGSPACPVQMSPPETLLGHSFSNYSPSRLPVPLALLYFISYQHSWLRLVWIKMWGLCYKIKDFEKFISRALKLLGGLSGCRACTRVTFIGFYSAPRHTRWEAGVSVLLFSALPPVSGTVSRRWQTHSTIHSHYFNG